MKHLLIGFCMLSFGFLLRAQTLTPTDKLALLQGKVTNFKGKALGNEVILISNEMTKAVYKISTDMNGKFELLVPVGATYAIRYKNFTMDMDYSKMTVPPEKGATYNVLIKLDPPKEFVLENVYFDTGKSTLKQSSNKALNDLVEVLKMKSTMMIEIQGHTDNAGTEENNLKLSQDRADAVRNYLIAKGIAENRIVSKGYGPAQPIADNTTEEGRSKNRRTSLKVIKE